MTTKNTKAKCECGRTVELVITKGDPTTQDVLGKLDWRKTPLYELARTKDEAKDVGDRTGKGWRSVTEYVRGGRVAPPEWWLTLALEYGLTPTEIGEALLAIAKRRVEMMEAGESVGGAA